LPGQISRLGSLQDAINGGNCPANSRHRPLGRRRRRILALGRSLADAPH
jgi:hypothetical protein